MGLDIYLYPRAASEANKVHYSIWNEDADGHYAAESMSDDERKAWGEEHPYVRHENVPSEKYPEHYFKRTYLRSSYNSGGFNNVVPAMVGGSGDLYWIFEPLGRDWRQGEDDAPLTTAELPGLREARERALRVAAKIRESEPLRVITVTENLFKPNDDIDDERALAIYREEAEKVVHADMGWYSNGRGEFFRKDPPTILAAIHGRQLGRPAVHLVYRDAEGATWYAEAAEITAEFCDEAIALIERDGSCEMSWSG